MEQNNAMNIDQNRNRYLDLKTIKQIKQIWIYWQ